MRNSLSYEVYKELSHFFCFVFVFFFLSLSSACIRKWKIANPILTHLMEIAQLSVVNEADDSAFSRYNSRHCLVDKIIFVTRGPDFFTV